MKAKEKGNGWFNRMIDKVTGSTPFDLAADNDNEKLESIRSSFNFVLRNLKFVIFTMIMLLAYISNRLICEKQFAQIDKLTDELTDVKYISMITEAELLKTSRPETIKELVDKNGLDLVEQDCPPYKVIYSEE